MSILASDAKLRPSPIVNAVWVIFGGKIQIFETIEGIFDYCSPAIIFSGIQINGLLTK